MMSSARAEPSFGTALTGVGHELERVAEFPVSGRRASTHVEHVGGEGGEALDVGVPGRRFDDPVAPLILVLRRREDEEIKR